MPARSIASGSGMNRGDYDSLLRKHVTDPAMWGVQAGTDFWLHAGGLNITAGRTLITDGGWTATSLSIVAGTGADFITKSDVGVPAQYLQNASADLLQSQALFGDYAHAHMAMVLMGQKKLPRYLILDAYATFQTASANEVTTLLGFVEAGGSANVAADALLMVYSRGTAGVFGIESGGTATAGVTAVDTVAHWFRFVLDKQTQLGYLSIDGIPQGSAALETDLFPVSVGTAAGTTNRIYLNQMHVFYSWQLGIDYGLI